MSIRNKFIFAFVSVLLVLVMVNEFSTITHGLQKSKQEWFEQNRVYLNTILDLQKRSVEVIAMELASDPVIIEAYKRNDPQMIIDEKMAFWKQVREKKLIYEIHFFKPPAISFVNFSNFTTIGTDVGAVRRDIAWVTSTFKNSQHLMMCKTYAGVRATFPIVDSDGTMLGGLSLGKKVEWIPSTLKTLTGKDAFLVYTESSAKSLAPQFYEHFIRNKERVNDHIFADRTLELPPQVEAEVDFSQQSQELNIGEHHYALNLYPLYDFNNKVMGYVGVLNDMERFYTRLFQRFATNFALILASMLLVYFIFQRYIRRLLERIGEMKSLARDFTNGRFRKLREYDLKALRQRSSADEIEHLQIDILEMGEALKGYYELLEERVSAATRELGDANRKLEQQLYFDTLTALPNRNAFFRDIALNERPAMALLDINGFKRLNDLYGIAVGNEVLQGFARFCSERGEAKGLRTYRFGSDEFALVPERDPEGFPALVVALIAEAEARMFIVGEERTGIYLDITAGISFERSHLVETADLALHEAQQHHKDHLVYDGSMGLYERNEKSIALTETIKNAIAENRVILHYQPIVDAQGRVTKHESLVRIVEGERLLSPFLFLEFAKQTRYYKTISRIVLEKAFARFTDCGDCPFSINITVDDILDSEIVALIKSLLKRFAQPERVVFEIVETENILNFDEVEEFIETVRGLGAKIAIDDFGSGYSNFSYILKIAPDYLKIDGSLIRHVHEDASALAIVTTIVGFAKALRIRTIAEFVHNEEVFEICRNLGIDEFQGYYFSEPLADPKH